MISGQNKCAVSFPSIEYHENHTTQSLLCAEFFFQLNSMEITHEHHKRCTQKHPVATTKLLNTYISSFSLYANGI